MVACRQAKKWSRPSSPASVEGLWECLPARPWAFSRPLTDKEEKGGFSATWRHPKWSSDWSEIPGVGLNHDFEARFLTRDCDHSEVDQWQICGLLTPLMIVKNNANDRHHITWEVASPILTGPNARQAPLDKLRLVLQGLDRELGGDPAYAMQTTKNPIYQGFETIWHGGQPVTLDDLASKIDIEAAIRDRQKNKGLALEDQALHSRNRTLFDVARFQAYEMTEEAKRNNDKEYLYNNIMNILQSSNARLSNSLPVYELKAIAKSITKFCWNNYSQKEKESPIRLFLRPEMSLKEKQAAGAAYASKAKKTASEEKILAAIGEMIARGETPTKAEVVRATGLVKNTVKKYWPANA